MSSWVMPGEGRGQTGILEGVWSRSETMAPQGASATRGPGGGASLLSGSAMDRHGVQEMTPLWARLLICRMGTRALLRALTRAKGIKHGSEWEDAVGRGCSVPRCGSPAPVPVSLSLGPAAQPPSLTRPPTAGPPPARQPLPQARSPAHRGTGALHC